MSPLIDPRDQWDEPEKAGDEPKGKEIECPGKKNGLELKVSGPKVDGPKWAILHLKRK